MTDTATPGRRHVLHDGVHPRAGAGRGETGHERAGNAPLGDDVPLAIVPVATWPRVPDGPVRVGDRLRRRLVEWPRPDGQAGRARVAHPLLSPDRLDAGVAYLDPAVTPLNPDATYRLGPPVGAWPVRIRAPGGMVRPTWALAVPLEPDADGP